MRRDIMPEPFPDALITLWQIHRDAAWPGSAGPNAGPLMTLDTVISGCVTYYLESEAGLDDQRVEILTTCLQDLEPLLQDLPDEVRHYFGRLSQLGSLLLANHRR